ncbi:MAG TPA: alternative ribosome rescue aminoacyl-tRNA hydrolase ArfB [Candidatus Binatia bacterium]|jgi:ribosome-associated protein|nr:alternative ribosome rescue aminoacyl-tRNA hydrolase ArfB [Candidatus Binatia bacterium]
MPEESDVVLENGLTIPAWELTFSFSPSGGPGGQHANRSATRVTLFFDVAHSPSLDEAQRERLLKRLRSRLDQDGMLQLSTQDTRSQHRNREIVVQRFAELLYEALKPRKRRRKTKPSAAANERRLRDKKQRGQRKKERGRDWRDKM